jgi:hypothetical protein
MILVNRLYQGDNSIVNEMISSYDSVVIGLLYVYSGTAKNKEDLWAVPYTSNAEAATMPWMHPSG